MKIMRVRPIAIAAALMAIVIVSLAHARRAQAQTSAVPVVDHTPDIQLARVINTAELHYKGQYGHFTTWDELYDSGFISSAAQHTKITIAKGPEVLPDTTLFLVVSPAEDNYSFAIHDNANGHGRYSVFSDQSGLIYQGQPIG